MYCNALFIIYRALGLIPGAVPTVQAVERKRRQSGHQTPPRDHDDYTIRPRREMSTTGEFGESSFLWPQVAGCTLNKRTDTWGKTTTSGKLRKICHNYRVSKKTDNPFKEVYFINQSTYLQKLHWNGTLGTKQFWKITYLKRILHLHSSTAVHKTCPRGPPLLLRHMLTWWARRSPSLEQCSLESWLFVCLCILFFVL